ncbi:hypothetical protein AGMMS49587_08600 [Spirochaetia bacterium]|nr:hypothetical protein AGMMS49587_08600 [Spirochaetia bacterium]
MKRISLFSLLCAFLLLSSCVTGKRRGSFTDYPAAPFFGEYRINSVTVTVDHINENSIAAQLFTICQTRLKLKQRYHLEEGQTPLLVDITVEQRSFMHKLNIYNSIYISCVTHDEAGTIYGKENKYITRKRTAITATELDYLMGPVIDKVLKKQGGQYRSALRYQKTHGE